jgi:hypothetical protein
MSLHLATSKTQKDLELPITTLITSLLSDILTKDLKLLKFDPHENTSTNTHEMHYNWMIAQVCCKELE